MPYPPGTTACPSEADGQAPHNGPAPAPNANPIPEDQQAPNSNGLCAVGPCAASLLGNVGYTTATGTDTRSGITFAPGEDIYGPFEAGFSTQQDPILEGLGCNPGSLGHVAGGIDTQTASAIVAHGCGIQLPRLEGTRYIGFLDECGGHTKEYHFHEKMSCLYKVDGSHSTKVGIGQDGQPIFGMWEGDNKKPLLDACGGHFGITPESGGSIVYHYHVQENPPFFIGCFGPAKDEAGNDKLVTLAECCAAYSGCGDNDIVTIQTLAGSSQYDPWCPCYDRDGSNVGTVELLVFSTPSEQTSCEGSCSEMTPVPEDLGSSAQDGFAAMWPILWIAGIAALCCCGCALVFLVCRGSGGEKRTKRGLGQPSDSSSSPEEEEGCL